MGLLKKIKNIFKKPEEEKQQEYISEKDLKIKIQDIEKKLNKKIEKDIDSFYEEIDLILDSLNEKSKILENFDINKRKVHERIRSITQVGRQEYLANVNFLISKLKEREKKDFTDFITKTLNEFEKRDKRAELKASQIIGKEIEEIKKDLEIIKRKANIFFQENSTTFNQKESIKRLYVLIENLDEKQAEINNLEKQQISISENIENSTKNLTEIERKIQEITESESYLERESTKEKINQEKNNLKKIETQIVLNIDDKIFRKYLYGEIESRKITFIENYLRNKVDCLEKDTNLIILEYILEMKEKAEKGKLVLKDNEKEKLDLLDKQIQQNRKDYIKTKNHLEKLEKSIQENNIQEKIDSLERTKKKITEEISNEKSSLERNSSEIKTSKNQQQSLKQEIAKILYTDLNIKMND